MDALQAAGAAQADWADVAKDVGVALGADATSIVVYNGRTRDVEAVEGQGVDPQLRRDYEAHYYQHDILLDGAPPSGEWQVSDERFSAQHLNR